MRMFMCTRFTKTPTACGTVTTRSDCEMMGGMLMKWGVSSTALLGAAFFFLPGPLLALFGMHDAARELLCAQKPFEYLVRPAGAIHDRVLEGQKLLQRQRARSDRMICAEQADEMMEEQVLLEERLFS